MFKAVQVSFTTWKSLHCHSTVFQLGHVLSGDYFYISAQKQQDTNHLWDNRTLLFKKCYD